MSTISESLKRKSGQFHAENVIIIKINEQTRDTIIKIMNKFTTLSLCALFMFLGIKGMQNSGSSVAALPTQTASAGTLSSSIPVLNGRFINTNNASTVIRDTVYIDSAKLQSKQVLTTKCVKVRVPKRGIAKVKTRYKTLLFIATPRDREKVTLDSVLNDSANWKIHKAICLKGSKDVRTFVRD